MRSNTCRVKGQWPCQKLKHFYQLTELPVFLRNSSIYSTAAFTLSWSVRKLPTSSRYGKIRTSLASITKTPVYDGYVWCLNKTVPKRYKKGVAKVDGLATRERKKRIRPLTCLFATSLVAHKPSIKTEHALGWKKEFCRTHDRRLFLICRTATLRSIAP